MNTKNINFSVKIQYEALNDGQHLCEKELMDLLNNAIENARLNGAISTDEISASKANVSITSITGPNTTQWTLSDEEENIAEQEGWGIFDSDTELQLQRDDHKSIFKDDNEAWNFVILKAATGSELHKKVINAIKNLNPDEYSLWVNRSRVFREFAFNSQFSNNKANFLENIGLSL